MFFFYGWGTNTKVLKYGQKCMCQKCNSVGYFNVVMHYSYFSLFFIPIIKWSKTYFLQCPVCGALIPIDNETFLNIKNGVIPEAPAEAPADPFAEEAAKPEIAAASEETPVTVEENPVIAEEVPTVEDTAETAEEAADEASENTQTE